MSNDFPLLGAQVLACKDAEKVGRRWLSFECDGWTPLWIRVNTAGKASGHAASIELLDPVATAPGTYPALQNTFNRYTPNYFGFAIAKYPSLLRTNRRGRPRGGCTVTLILCHLPSLLKFAGLYPIEYW